MVDLATGPETVRRSQKVATEPSGRQEENRVTKPSGRRPYDLYNCRSGSEGSRDSIRLRWCRIIQLIKNIRVTHLNSTGNTTGQVSSRMFQQVNDDEAVCPTS